jgi:TonB family protein
MSALLLSLVVRGQLALTAAIVVVLLLRHPVRVRFGPLAAYALWLAPPLCLLAALLPAYAPPAALSPMILKAVSQIGTVAALTRPAPDLAAPLLGAWAIGAAVTAGLFAIRQAQFVRSLGRLTPSPADPAVLRGEHRGSGPMLLGALRPRIVAPADFEQRFHGAARELVLAHESVHLRRGDAAINALAVVLRCLAWFNPLVHLAARRLRVDQEIACDAAVVAARPHDRRLYAELLLGAALTPFSAPFGCHWPATGVHPLKERLMMLNVVSTTPLRRKIGMVLVCAVGLAGAGAVWAANPAPRHVITKPNWSSRPTGEDMARFYPVDAAKAKIEGKATIDCRVAVDGRLNSCTVRSESPAQAGFGEASLQLTQYFQMTPATLDGKPTAGGQVTIPINFQVDPK